MKFFLFLLALVPLISCVHGTKIASNDVSSKLSHAAYKKVGKYLVHPEATETVGMLHKKLTMNHQGKDYTSSVQSLINRVLSRAGVDFTFEPILESIDYETVDGQQFDVFEIDSQDGKIVFRGSSGVALATAFGHYLRYYTNSDFHWEHGGGYSFDTFPKSLSEFPTPSENERVVFLSKWRYYQNTCTASYSFAWKNWAQWEADIDWMVMNGFNLPLAFTEKHEPSDLQKQILARYSDLGLTPVLPAFNGVVPEEMAKLFPSANITQLTSWNNFPEQYSYNYILSSTDPLFVEIGKNFLDLQFELFGETAKSHIYNCDTFNENKPASSDPEYLSSSSSAVYNSMIAADPDAVWLMQGWLFVNDREFWTDDNIRSYLSGVPDHGMVILDLSSEDLPVWQKISANNKQFIWCMLHNYGGSRALYGDLSLLSTDPINVQKEVPGYFLGTGLTMEAIDQNPVVYELMSEMAFHREAPNVTEWIENYAIRRYGLLSSEITKESKNLAIASWVALFHNNYDGESPVCHHPCYRRSILTLHPAWNMFQDKSTKATPLVDIWTTLLYTNISNSNRAYAYDLVDVGRQVMSNLFYDYYAFAQAAYTAKDFSSFLSMSTEMIQLIRDWDKLLSSHESYLLGKWIADARAWAKDATEADLFDFNARNQITLWGNNGEIDDYAAKNWGGLVRGYYLQRWELLLQTTLTAVKKGENINEDDYNSKELKIGQDFCEDYKTVFPTEAQGDSVTISHEMHDKYGNGYKSQHFYILQKNKDIQGYDIIPTPTWSKNLKQLQKLCDAAYYCVGFTTEGLLKSNSANLVDREGVHTFLKGKCSSEKCAN